MTVEDSKLRALNIIALASAVAELHKLDLEGMSLIEREIVSLSARSLAEVEAKLNPRLADGARLLQERIKSLYVSRVLGGV
jgi:hypothetical protein